MQHVLRSTLVWRISGLWCFCVWIQIGLLAQMPDPVPPKSIDKPGLHNTHRITDWLYSGSSPEGAEGFQSLKEMGIQTVISVDGARPEVERARQSGLRYVHLPIGYDGIPREQLLRLVKATRTMPRPIYLHCHHGKHRGPAAAAALHLCEDETCTVKQALAEMRTFGTDPKYRGLYDAVSRLTRPTAAELDAVPAELPEVAEVASFVERMVEIDLTWDRLKAVRAAKWKAPPDHPDLVPAQEALQLVEHYREAARLPEHAQRPAGFQALLQKAELGAVELERVLREAETKKVDSAALDAVYKKSEAACAACHKQFRDNK